jgi:hypothetical protein
MSLQIEKNITTVQIEVPKTNLAVENSITEITVQTSTPQITISQAGVRGLGGEKYKVSPYFATPKVITENVIIPPGQNAIMVGDVAIGEGYIVEVSEDTDLRII